MPQEDPEVKDGKVRSGAEVRFFRSGQRQVYSGNQDGHFRPRGEDTSRKREFIDYKPSMITD